MKEIVFNINPDGSVQVETRGYKGRDCLSATKPYEDALGIVDKRQPKPELRSGQGVCQNAGQRITNR